MPLSTRAGEQRVCIEVALDVFDKPCGLTFSNRSFVCLPDWATRRDFRAGLIYKSVASLLDGKAPAAPPFFKLAFFVQRVIICNVVTFYLCLHRAFSLFPHGVQTGQMVKLGGCLTGPSYAVSFARVSASRPSCVPGGNFTRKNGIFVYRQSLTFS